MWCIFCWGGGGGGGGKRRVRWTVYRSDPHEPLLHPGNFLQGSSLVLPRKCHYPKIMHSLDAHQINTSKTWTWLFTNTHKINMSRTAVLFSAYTNCVCCFTFEIGSTPITLRMVVLKHSWKVLITFQACYMRMSWCGMRNLAFAWLISCRKWEVQKNGRSYKIKYALVASYALQELEQ